MKRNTIFAAAALLVAGAAIGAGSVVSQNAMADTGAPALPNELTMVNIGADGAAVQCTFSGADVVGLVPAGIPESAAASGHVWMGQVTAADGSLPELQVPADGQLPAGSTGSVSVEANSADGVVINGQPSTTRDGTADECAAMRTQAIELAKSVPAGATVIGASGEVSGGISVSGVSVNVSPKP